MNRDEKKKPEVKKKKSARTIMPLRDFHIVFNKHDIKIEKGVEIDVPVIFIPNLITEKVINENSEVK